MDDTADKVRRNSVALSALIIGAWWLQLKVPEQLKLPGLADGLPLQGPARVWWAVALVHIYCFSRFVFSEDGAKSRREWGESWGRMIRDKVSLLLEAQARRNALKGRASSCVSALPKSDTPSGFIGVRAEVTSNDTPWAGIVQFHWKVVDGEEMADATNSFSVPWYLRLRILASTLRDIAYSSHIALEFLWPVLLFLGASIVIVVRLLNPH